MSTLLDDERQRYQRQILLPDWGEEGQLRLKDAVVFIAGAGGLGSPLALYLAAAGVGTLRICDRGEPELSNLNRQILHGEADLGRSKAWSARDSLARVNPRVRVIPLAEEIDRGSVERLAGEATVLVDCLDNLETRHVLNELSVRRAIPLVHAGVHGLCGQLTFFHPPRTPCLACVFPETMPRETFPIVGATAGVIGCLQALEILKYLTGTGSLLAGRLLIWDGAAMSFHDIRLERNRDCRVCGAAPIGGASPGGDVAPGGGAAPGGDASSGGDAAPGGAPR